jgi:clusterin-associated protein 1
LPEDIATEAQRVKLLTTTAELLLTKARLRLNIKRLYAADGSAVAELLKLAELLHKATRAAGSENNVSARVGKVPRSSCNRRHDCASLGKASKQRRPCC